MVAVAAIQDEAGSPKTKIHVYYNLQNKNLGFQFRNEQDSEDTKLNTFDSDENAHEGYIINQSHLASTKFHNKELVFGVTEKKGFTINNQGQPCQPVQQQKDCDCPKDAYSVDIALVSPVYKVVSSAYSDNYKIAACSSPKDTWVYYLKKNPRNNALNIFEATIGPANDTSFTDTTTILPGSALAAYYDPKSKSQNIIYQSTTDNQLREYTVKVGDTRIDAAKGVKALSTLAIAVNDTTVFLYFVDSNTNTISRITKKLGGGKWHSLNSVDGADKITADSQLTVTTAAGANHLFYKAEDQSEVNGLTHVINAWEDE